VVLVVDMLGVVVVVKVVVVLVELIVELAVALIHLEMVQPVGIMPVVVEVVLTAMLV